MAKAMDFVRTSSEPPRGRFPGSAPRTRPSARKREAVGFRPTLQKVRRASQLTSSMIAWDEPEGALVEVETQLMSAPILASFTPKHGKQLLVQAAEWSAY